MFRLGYKASLGLLIVILLSTSITGCQSFVDKGSINQIQLQKVVASWNLLCGDHELLVQPMCRIHKGPLTYELTVMDKRSRNNLFAIESLKVGYDHHPKSIVFIRKDDWVEDGFEPSIYSSQAKPMLLSGGEILVRWTQWPSKGRSLTINVDGFEQAYSEAMRWLKKSAN